MTAYTITIFGRNDLGYPAVSNSYIDAETPADTIMEPDMGWTVEAVRHDEAGAVCAYKINRGSSCSDLMVERSSTDCGLWMIFTSGVLWVGTIRES